MACARVRRRLSISICSWGPREGEGSWSATSLGLDPRHRFENTGKPWSPRAARPSDSDSPRDGLAGTAVALSASGP